MLGLAMSLHERKPAKPAQSVLNVAGWHWLVLVSTMSEHEAALPAAATAAKSVKPPRKNHPPARRLPLPLPAPPLLTLSLVRIRRILGPMICPPEGPGRQKYGAGALALVTCLLIPSGARADGPAPAAPAAPPPSIPTGDTYQDLAVLSLTLATFSGTTVPVCIFTTGPGTIGRQACEGIAGGAAAALALTTIPLFVISRRQHSEWLRANGAPAVQPGARGVTLGWVVAF
jgi:hypothetical protein